MKLMMILAVIGLAGAMSFAQPERRTTDVRNENYNDSPYGMNGFHPNGPAPHGHLIHFTDENIQRLIEGNVRWVRLMVDWRYCEPEPGEYYWASLERVVQRLNEHNIGISACLYEPPDWAMTDPESHYLVDPNHFERFGRAIARQFRGRIAAYEIYNERPTGAWPQVAHRRAAVFVPILRAAYTGIKAGDPNAIVMPTGLWEFPLYYIEDMYRQGAADYFDAVNIHYYLRSDRDPRYMDAFRGDLPTVLQYVAWVTAKYNDADKPIWFTEYGWPATDESQAFPVGDELMAEYMRYFLETCRDSGLVERAIWYVYYMSDGMALWHEREDRKRPAYYIHTTFAEHWPSWNDLPTQPLNYPPPATAAVEVADGDFETGAAWDLDLSSPVRLVDTDPQHGRRCLHVMANDGPVEIVGEDFALEPGKAYRLTGYVRMTGGDENPQYPHAMIHIDLLGEDGSRLGLLGPRQGETADSRSTNYYISETDGQWYQVHYPIYTPAECHGGRIVLRLGHDGADPGQAWFDNIQIEPLDLGEFQR